MAWSPDGNYIASASEDMTIRVMDVRDIQCNKYPHIQCDNLSSSEKRLCWTLEGHLKQ